MDNQIPLTSLTFRVGTRHVGTNPSDPDGLRRSQRRVADLLETPGIQTVAFHAPTGSGKTHILRHLARVNAAFMPAQQTRLIFAFPIRSLVLQQAYETGALSHDMSTSFERFTRVGEAAEKGSDEAALYKEFLRTLRVPPSYRPSVIMQGVLSADLARPLALTPDALWLALRGIIADADLDSDEMAEYDAAQIIQALQGEGPPLRRQARYAFPKGQAQAFLAELSSALVVLDEYHLLAGHPAFGRLVETLHALGTKLLLMSGTSRQDFLQARLPGVTVVDFDLLEKERFVDADEPKIIFNHPLEVTVSHIPYTRPQDYDPYNSTKATIEAWETQGSVGPTLVVFECLARFRKTLLTYLADPLLRDRTYWWTGPMHDTRIEAMLSGKATMPKDAIVLATSAIELGVDLPFRNLITESEYHATLLQRIARAGRQGTFAKGLLHHIHILTRRPLRGGPPKGPVSRERLSEELARILGLPLMPPDEDREGLYLRSSKESPMLAIWQDQTTGKWQYTRSHPGLLLAFPPGPITAPDWSRMDPGQRRRMLVDEWGIPTHDAHKILWEEGFTPTRFAYIHTGALPLEGTLELRDTTIPYSNSVLRRYVLTKRRMTRGKARNPAQEKVLAEYRIPRRAPHAEENPLRPTSGPARAVDRPKFKLAL